jgi:SagB-type dehydrogenase family enzyme
MMTARSDMAGAGLLAVATLILVITGAGCMAAKENPQDGLELVPLPEPDTKGKMPVEQAVRQRRSVREYAAEPPTLTQVAQLLWAAQGITHADGLRAAPSAGALYPLEVYLVAGVVEGLEPGIYRYHPHGHDLEPVLEGDRRIRLSRAALRQDCVRNAPAVLVFTAVYERTTGKYGDRGIRYVHMDLGFAAENVYLQAQALGMGTVMVGAFHDDKVRAVLGAPDEEVPIAIMPVGRVP